MTVKDSVLWIDMLAGASKCSPPIALNEQFDVKVVHRDALHHGAPENFDSVGIFYDCDYVDVKRIGLMRQIKIEQPSIPFVLVTLQHSEGLAVWALRNKALDYLVKPVPADELSACIKRLQSIAEHRLKGGARNIINSHWDPPEAARSRQEASDKLAPAVFYVQSHFNERIYSDAVARICGLSASYFSRAFHERFKMTFQEFLLRYRVAKAAIKLGEPNASISDVCFSVGFRDPSYFTRVFKRQTGVSPSEFSKGSKAWKKSVDYLQEIDDASNSSSQIVRALDLEIYESSRSVR